MTEAEWLACEDPSAMLVLLEARGCGGNRKFRLFAVACCRRVWSGLKDERSRAAVEMAERYADGNATQGALREAFVAATAAVADCRDFSPFSEYQAIGAFLSAARCITESATKVPMNEDACEVASHVWSFAIKDELGRSDRGQCSLLHELFGNPFRPVTFAPEWRTDTVVTLARTMYESREFSAMPILADALQDAGCDNDDVLNHCRELGTHVRGCWVCDLVLGKV
jgi:hypothetical protein